MKKKDNNFLEDLYLVITKRSSGKDKNSYTKSLLSKGKKKIAEKIKEESSELIKDYLKGTKKEPLKKHLI